MNQNEAIEEMQISLERMKWNRSYVMVLHRDLNQFVQAQLLVHKDDSSLSAFNIDPAVFGRFDEGFQVECFDASASE